MGVSRHLQRGRTAAVDEWRSVEELTRWGFAHAPVVMANEAHSGLSRCVRTRDIGVRIIEAAHKVGVQHLAMEALPRPEDGTPGRIRAVPPVPGGYLAQPDMRRLITTAVELGWTLRAYEADIQPVNDPAAATATPPRNPAAGGSRWDTTSRRCPASTLSSSTRP